ncbi:MAG TPA: hypothetical protein VGL13_00405 [Polyangiaceae bacterium]|jgi:hypothetical protein
MAVPLIAACSLGEGEGQVESDALFVQDCLNGGPFRLDPTFFGAQPFMRTVTLRIQHGGDTEEVSDGLQVLIDNIDQVRSAISAQGGSADFRVALQPSVVPPGYPVVIDSDPAIVHAALYLHRACHAQNAALYALSGTMTFHSLFDNDVNESDSAQKLNWAEFTDIQVGDPRDRDPGSTTVLNQTALRGNFKFYFQRGQPAQPFP